MDNTYSILPHILVIRIGLDGIQEQDGLMLPTAVPESESSKWLDCTY